MWQDNFRDKFKGDAKDGYQEDAIRHIEDEIIFKLIADFQARVNISDKDLKDIKIKWL